MADSHGGISESFNLKKRMMDVEINQLAANLSFGDAISNEMVEIYKTLKRKGYKTRIFAQYLDPRMKQYFTHFSEYKGDKNNTLIFHASIGGEIFDYIKNLPDKKIMIYHNMTPAHFFEGYNDTLCKLLSEGRAHVKQLAPHIDLGVGDSDFNRKELEEYGYAKTDVFPILFNPAKYDVPSVNSIETEMSKHGTNILFVGRYSPNKKQDDVIKTFYIYKTYFNPDSHLHLIGNYDGSELYYLQLQALVRRLGLEESVTLHSHVSSEELVTFYRNADAFLCMSEHEGFLVPILESFHFNVPFFGFHAGAVPETAANGGVIFKEKDFYKIAESMDEVLKNKNRKTELIERQRNRLRDFGHDKLEEKLTRLIQSVI